MQYTSKQVAKPNRITVISWFKNDRLNNAVLVFEVSWHIAMQTKSKPKMGRNNHFDHGLLGLGSK